METSIRIISENIAQYIPSLGRIYREAFPDHKRSVLGQSTCERYLRTVSQHRAYQVMIALVNNESAGFVVFHVDLQARLGRKWLLRNAHPIVRFAVLNPLFTFRMTRNLLMLLYNDRKRRRNTPVNENIVRTRPLRAYVETLAVKSAYRGLGVGKRLLEECIKVARENNKTRLGITVDIDNYKALQLYQGIGFKPQHPVGRKLDLVYDLKP